MICKNEEDPIKNRGARVFTTLYINFSDAQGQITLELVVVCDRNLNSSKLSCMSSLPAIMRMIESKMKELECSLHKISPIISLWFFSRCSRAANSEILGPICPNFELNRYVMNIFVTCKYEEDPIKNEGTRVFTTFSGLPRVREKSGKLNVLQGQGNSGNFEKYRMSKLRTL